MKFELPKPVKYSKEASESAHDEVEKLASNWAEHAFRKGADRMGKADPAYTFLADGALLAKRKLDKIMAVGEKDADKLNERFDALLAKARQAVKELEDFKVQELGMGPKPEQPEAAEKTEGEKDLE